MYTQDMQELSKQTLSDLVERAQSKGYPSPDDLVRAALQALDEAESSEKERLERDLLAAMETEEIELTAAEWANIRRDASDRNRPRGR